MPRPKEVELTGYYVLDTWGNIEHGSVQARYTPETGAWHDTTRDVEIIFQESDDLPGQEDHGGWTYGPYGKGENTRSLYRPNRDNVRGVAVVYPGDAVFVLDDTSVARINRIDSAAIDWLPSPFETLRDHHFPKAVKRMKWMAELAADADDLSPKIVLAIDDVREALAVLGRLLGVKS
jgi:hypothetical protein